MILHLTDIHIPPDDIAKINEIKNIFDSQIINHVNKNITVCITGDLFDSADTPIGSLGFELANYIVYNLQNKAKAVIVIRGTITHDAPNALNHFKYFGDRVYVVEKPEVIKIDNYTFFAMPGAYAGNFTEEQEQGVNVQQLIINQLKSWGREFSKGTKGNKVFLGHMALSEVQGNLKSLQEFQDIHYEPPIDLDVILKEINPSIILLGHIHKDYKFERTFYGGALLQHNFNEANVYELKKDGKFDLVVNNNRYFCIYDLEKNRKETINIEQSYEKVILICSNDKNYKRATEEFLDSRLGKVIDLMIKTDSKEIRDDMQKIISKYDNIREFKIKITAGPQLSERERLKKEMSSKIISSIDPYEQFKIYVTGKYPKEEINDSLFEEHKSFYDSSLTNR